MPSMLIALGSIVNEGDVSLKASRANADARVKAYTYAQLTALRKQTLKNMERLPECSLKTANQLFVDRLDKELAVKEAAQRAELGRSERRTHAVCLPRPHALNFAK